MRQTILSITIILYFTLCFGNAFAQTQTPNTPQKPIVNTVRAKTWERDSVKNTDPSLNGQYQFMLSRTRTSPDGYKMVAKYRLDQLWKNVSDTLRKERAEKRSLQQKLTDQGKTVNYLKTEISGKDASLNESNDKLNEIKLLGISFDKGTYSIIVWSIIGVLVIALIIIVARSGKNISEAKHRSQLYNEISEEYQAYKSKAVEKERRLARELQDERNKLEELTNGKR